MLVFRWWVHSEGNAWVSKSECLGVIWTDSLEKRWRRNKGWRILWESHGICLHTWYRKFRQTNPGNYCILLLGGHTGIVEPHPGKGEIPTRGSRGCGDFCISHECLQKCQCMEAKFGLVRRPGQVEFECQHCGHLPFASSIKVVLFFMFWVGMGQFIQGVWSLVWREFWSLQEGWVTVSIFKSLRSHVLRTLCGCSQTLWGCWRSC